MFEPADFLEESLRWAARVLTGEVDGRTGPTIARADRGGVGRRGRRAAGSIADGKVHGAAPAPYRALDLIAARRDRDAGTKASPPRTRRWPT